MFFARFHIFAPRFCRPVLESQYRLFPFSLDVLSVAGAAMIGDCLVWCCNTFWAVKLWDICPVQSTKRTELRLTYIPPHMALACAPRWKCPCKTR